MISLHCHFSKESSVKPDPSPLSSFHSSLLCILSGTLPQLLPLWGMAKTGEYLGMRGELSSRAPVRSQVEPQYCRKGLSYSKKPT